MPWLVVNFRCCTSNQIDLTSVYTAALLKSTAALLCHRVIVNKRM